MSVKKTFPFMPLVGGDALLVGSEDELLEMVLNYNGTLTNRLITPQIANWILQLNKHNRHLYPTYVAKLKGALERGEWQETGEPIIISKEGILNDGQHRLSAIAESGIAAVCDVRFGIDRAAFLATGTGKKRNAADALAIMQYANTNCLASAARYIYHYENSIGDYSKSITNAQVLEIVRRHPIIEQVVSRVSGSKFKPLRIACIVAIMVLAAEQSDMATLELFLHTAETGLTTNPDDAARKLHMKLVDISLARGQTYAIDYMILAAKAWNYWIRGKDLKRLASSGAERSKEGFPYLTPPRKFASPSTSAVAKIVTASQEQHTLPYGSYSSSAYVAKRK